jgi:hemolysin activation/secretion protein
MKSLHAASQNPLFGFISGANSLTQSALAEQPSHDDHAREQLEAEKGYLKGILLLDSPSLVTKTSGEIFYGVRSYGVEVPGGFYKFEKAIFAEFDGDPLTVDLLQNLKQKIVTYYRENGHPVVSVDIPFQDVTDGVVQIIIMEGVIDKVEFKGNRWFSTRLLQSYSRLKSGDHVDKKILVSDLAWMNRNPFRQTDVVFAAGDEEGTTNLEFVTKDRLPLRVYIGGDNTGTDATGKVRWFAGITWGNAFDADHQFTYQATVSSDFHKFVAHTVDYVAPLPWRHVFQVYGGYAEIHPHIHDFHSEGKNGQGSLRYRIPLFPNGTGYLSELTFGFDYKYTNSNFFFLDNENTPIIVGQVNITQIMGAYSFAKETPHNKFWLDAQVYYSPGKWLPHQSNEDFQKFRPDAKNKYMYGRLALGDIVTFGKGFSIYFLSRFQGSSEPLLPSEQFGLGGYDTVRGYEEREVNLDNAVCLNLELRTPKFTIFDKFDRKRKIKDELYFFVFADYAYGVNNAPIVYRFFRPLDAI